MKEKKVYKFSLRLNGEHKKPLEKSAEKNKRSINNEINVAIENHLKKDKEIDKTR